MKRLLLKSLFLALALYLTVALGAYLCRRELDPNNYLSVIVDKHKRLESLPSPRLIFIGDSALPFGLDGERIEKELKIPVANMGLHAAFGLSFIFEEIYSDLRPGDIVVAIFHYYPSDKEINEGVVCHALDFYPAMYRRLELNYFSKKKLEATCDIKRIRRYLLNRIFRSNPSGEIEIKGNEFGYRRWAFNEFGDVYDDLYKTSNVEFLTGSSMKFDTGQSETVALLNYYDKIFSEKGAKLLMIYPPHPETNFNNSLAAINEFDKLLRESTKVKLLSKPGDSVYADNYFFNTDYHLTSPGKKLYTDFVINIIKKEMSYE